MSLAVGVYCEPLYMFCIADITTSLEYAKGTTVVFSYDDHLEVWCM